MSRWRRLTKVGGIAAGVAVGGTVAGAGIVLAAEKIAIGRQRLRPDPAAGEPLGQLRGRSLTVLADDGVPLHAEVSGPDDAPVTIIFSHGYTLSQDVWHYQRQVLEGTARLVFWDQRGHGRTAQLGPGRPEAGRVSGRAAGGQGAGEMAAVRDARERPAGGRSVGDWAAGDWAAGDRAAGDRAAGDRAAGERAAAGRAAADVVGQDRAVPESALDRAATGHAPGGQVTIGQLGADLAAILAATAPGDGPVVLVGHSMGGMTVMALAGQQPDLFGTKVIGTALISTAAAGVDLAGWLPAPLRLAARQAAPVALRGVSHSRPAALVERCREAGGDIAFLSTRLLAFGDPRVSPAVVDFLERIIRATPVAVITEFYLALREHDQRGALAAVGRAPAVVITGDRDRIISPRLAASLAAGIPGADLVLVPGAGHVVILERPEAVNDAITALVTRALDPAGAQSRSA